MRCKVWKRNIYFMIFGFFCLLAFSACGTAESKSIQFFSMDTIMKITSYGNCEHALPLARDRIESLDAMLDATDPNSLVSTLKNGDTIGTDLKIPLQTVQQIAALTNGSLDATLYPLSDAWGFYSGNYHVPIDETIRTCLQNRGTWRIENNRFFCSNGLKIDLGCVAKGYAADCAVKTLRENGVKSAVLMLGGNVQTLGRKPDGSSWNVSVADPQETNNSVGILHVGECAVVTSGSYQRNFTENGKTYHHILDPSTGYPAESGLLSVTVVCSDGATADALSTALFIIGVDQARQLYTNHDISFEALFISEENQIFLTEGLADCFEQTNETYAPFTVLQ